MKELKRISKQANDFLMKSGFSKEEVKDGACRLYRTRNGYSIRFDILEVPPKSKKKLFRGLNTPKELIQEALTWLDRDQPLIVLKALAIAERMIKNEPIIYE